MKLVPFPTCIWVTENLLVGGIDGYTVELPAAAVKRLRSAGVDWIINLLSKEQFVAAGSDALFGGIDRTVGHARESVGRQRFSSPTASGHPTGTFCPRPVRSG